MTPRDESKLSSILDDRNSSRDNFKGILIPTNASSCPSNVISKGSNDLVTMFCIVAIIEEVEVGTELGAEVAVALELGAKVAVALGANVDVVIEPGVGGGVGGNVGEVAGGMIGSERGCEVGSASILLSPPLSF
jgi:hypothetical protein